jgi:hypothetical protein
MKIEIFFRLFLFKNLNKNLILFILFYKLILLIIILNWDYLISGRIKKSIKIIIAALCDLAHLDFFLGLFILIR